MFILTRAGWANYISKSFDIGLSTEEQKAVFFEILEQAKLLKRAIPNLSKRDEIFLAAFLMRYDRRMIDHFARFFSTSRDHAQSVFERVCGLIVSLASENSGAWVEAVKRHQALTEGTPFSVAYLLGREGLPTHSDLAIGQINFDGFADLLKTRLSSVKS